jgi:membrane protein
VRATAHPAHFVLRPARSFASGARYYVSGVFKRLFSTPAPLWAQAIAFKVLVTLLPLVLLGTGVLGFWLRGASPFETVAGYLRSFLPPSLSEPLVGLVFELQAASGALTIVGAAALVLAAVSLLATLRYVVGQAMGADRHTPRSIHGGYLFDLRMTVQVGLLFLLSFGLTFAVNVLSVHSLAWAGRAGIDPTMVERLWRVILRVLTFVVPYLLSVGMFTQLFYFVPRPPPPLRSAFVGATVTAALFEAAKNGFTFYARYVGDFGRYDGGPGDTLGGVFGLIIGFVFWVYLSGLVLVIGTMVVALHEARFMPRRRPASRWVTRRLRQKHQEPSSAAAPPAEA